MSPFLLYLIIKLDAITNFLQMVSALPLMIAAIGVMWFIIVIDHTKENKGKAKKIAKYTIIALTFFLIVHGFRTLIPTTKEAAILLVVPKTINSINKNEKLKNIPNKLLDLADDWIDEFKPNKKHNKINNFNNLTDK